MEFAINWQRHSLQSMRQTILDILEDSTSPVGKYLSIIVIFAIYCSVVLVVIDARFSQNFKNHEYLLIWVGHAVQALFTVELLLRIICDPNRWKYLRGFHGLVDIIAVVPGLIALVLPLPFNSLWLRVFRILQFTRALKFIRAGGAIGGVTGRLAPYFASAIALKGMMVAFEGEAWWPKFDNLNIIIGVSGFALAILLGTKMRVLTGRLYTIEDAISRIVGALRDMRSNAAICAAVDSWALAFLQTLRSSTTSTFEVVRLETDQLESDLECAQIGGANTAGFHRDVEYVLHRANSHTPPAFDRFLRYITTFYAGTVIVAVPGLTGFFASVLLIYVIGGMYLLIEDMDEPLNYAEESLINVDLGALERYCEQYQTTS